MRSDSRYFFSRFVGEMQRAFSALVGRSSRRLSTQILGVASSPGSCAPSSRSDPSSSSFVWRSARQFCASDGSQASPPSAEGDKAAAEKPVKRKKLSKKERFGKYDQEFEDEMAQVPIDESVEHLYDTRPIVEKWMGHPTFYDMISEDAYPKGEAPKGEPPGEGPILRWETRVVLSPGGEAFHPANRKVKVSVYVKELELTPIQKERLLAMVGKRYNPNKDELTIVSERFEAREENRKDVMRILLDLIEECKKSDEVVEGAQQI